MSENKENKEKKVSSELKKGRSMVWKITFDRVFENISLFFSIDILIMIIFSISLLHFEVMAASQIIASTAETAVQTATRAAAQSSVPTATLDAAQPSAPTAAQPSAPTAAQAAAQTTGPAAAQAAAQPGAQTTVPTAAQAVAQAASQATDQVAAQAAALAEALDASQAAAQAIVQAAVQAIAQPAAQPSAPTTAQTATQSAAQPSAPTTAQTPPKSPPPLSELAEISGGAGELQMPEGLPRPVRQGVSVWINEPGEKTPIAGVSLPERVYSYAGLPGPTILGFQYEDNLERFPYSLTGVSMIMITELDLAPGYQVVVVSNPADAIRYFLTSFIVLLAIEVLNVIFGIFGARRSAKKIMRPINDLTRTTQNINVESPLHLSGAIDTLNTITERDLDKRISIADEREELRGLARAINNMLDRLDAAYQAQLRFVSDASHELRTPIAVIQGYANLLDRWGKNDEKALQESIDAIKNEAEEMKNLVEQLLFLARSDNNTITFSLKNVDLAAIAREVEFETGMIDGSHVFSSDIDEKLAVFGDEQLLKRALRIFVDNSIKYTPEGGEIKISAKGHGDQIKVSVSDTGVGIPDEDIPRVFDRFFRADESRTRKSGGTGLGLSIAKWIVERSGGYLEIISRTEIGTKITAVFPRSTVADLPEQISGL